LGLQKLVVYDEEVKSDSNTFNKRIVYLNSSNNENIFIFEVKNIVKIIDKLISEGKITLMINLNQKNIINKDSKTTLLNNDNKLSKNNLSFDNQITTLRQNYELENYIIFVSQSTKEILDNFLKYVKNFQSEYNNNNKLIVNNNNDKNNKNKECSNNSNLIDLNDKADGKKILSNCRFGQKRKYEEFYKNYENRNIANNINSINNSNYTNDVNSKNINNQTNIKIPRNPRSLNTSVVNLNKNLDVNNKKFLGFNNINSLENRKANRKFLIDNIPDLIISEVFEYLDKQSANNFSLINKQIKKLHDGFMENLELRADTPADMFGFILKRYENLRKLKFGKGKKIKNEVFKNLNSNLKNLICLDISEIDNLNESSITKILSKTKPKNLTSLKINFDINCLNAILSYIRCFTVKLEEMVITSQNLSYYFKTVEENENLFNLLSLNKIISFQYHNLLLDILKEKMYLRKFEVFLFNLSLVKTIILEVEEDKQNHDIKNTNLIENNTNDTNTNNSHIGKRKESKEKNNFVEYKITTELKYITADLFSNLHCLYFEILIIRNIKDICALKTAVNLNELTIKNILLLETPNKQKIYKDKTFNKISNSNNAIDLYSSKLTKINFNNFQQNIEEIEKNLNSNFEFINNNLNQIVKLPNEDMDIEYNNNFEESKNENNKINALQDIDLEDDYVETFIEVFSNIRALIKIEMGEFINGDILKVICNFSKNISHIKLKSNLLDDNDIIQIMKKMKHLENLDLRGCANVYGNCFIEIEKLPDKLQKVKLSIQSFNFYNLIDYLRKNNIEAQNYL